MRDVRRLLSVITRSTATPRSPPYRPGDRDDLPRIAFVADPDGYRVELIDGGAFATPRDGP